MTGSQSGRVASKDVICVGVTQGQVRRRRDPRAAASACSRRCSNGAVSSAQRDWSRPRSTVTSSRRVGLDGRPEPLDDVLLDLGGQQAALAGVAPEDVAEARGHDDPEAVVAAAPRRRARARSRCRSPGRRPGSSRRRRSGRFSTKSGSLRQAANSPSSKPVRVTRLR